jgi:hypothetical protein
MAGRRTFHVLTSSQQSGTKEKYFALMDNSHAHRRGVYRPMLPHAMTTFTPTTVCPTVRTLLFLCDRFVNRLITDLSP